MKKRYIEKLQLLDEAEIKKTLQRIAGEIVERNSGLSNLGLIGIWTRGVHIARRLQAVLKKRENIKPPLGTIDITLYRDDALIELPRPIVGPTEISFQIKDKIIILVDDVLYTGRTVRAALDAIIDFGRPKAIQLAVLIDRGLREFPIQADYIGKFVQTQRNQSIKVLLKEEDKEERVVLREMVLE
jgi:pyrimidine operon attenuation protein/uracil phosphoribosyltransferase